MTKQAAEKRIKQLRKAIEDYRYQYHVLDKSPISDAAHDSLKHELAKLEEQYPDLVTPTSPTQRVGGQPLPQFKQYSHRTPMLSLNDAFDWEELKAWETRNKKIVAGEYTYISQLKIDGVAVALVYENGQLIRGVTRGDGQVGEDVTHTIRTIEAIPLTLRQPHTGRLEVRGEVYMTKKDFTELNKTQEKSGKPPFANPRNVSAGSIRQLDPAVAAARPLRFLAWELTEGIPLETRQEELQQLRQLGFATPPNGNQLFALSELKQYIAKQEKQRLQHPFQVDGLVIKINSLRLHQRLGIIGKAPRGSIAYKFAAEEATTIVEDIVVQVGRTGALTPVAHLKPVTVAGTTVSRATLHNADEIARKDVRVGDTIILRKAGDIIPEVIAVIEKMRPPKTKPFKMPSRCPICNSSVKKEEGGAIYRCPNPECFPVQRERILHAVGPPGFDIDGLGEKIVEQLLQQGLITDPPDLWELTVGDLTPLERFAEKSAQKIIGEVKARKKITLPRFLVALSIPHVGTITAQDLAREFGTVSRLKHASPEKLAEVEGIGEKVAQAIADFFNSHATEKLLQKYHNVGIKVQAVKTQGALSGKTFVFTGTLPDMSRDEAKRAVTERGGKVTSSIGHTIDYVVVGNDPGSKARKAKELNLQRLTPTQFFKMIKIK